MYFEWGATLEKSKASRSLIGIWILKLKAFFNQKLVVNRTYLLQKSIDHCEEALKINPAYHFAHDNLGNAYYEFGNYIKARNSFRNAILYEPTYPEATNDLAMIYLVPEFEGYDISLAKSLHLDALNLLDDKNEENRREKLKTIFKNRMTQLNISEG